MKSCKGCGIQFPTSTITERREYSAHLSGCSEYIDLRAREAEERSDTTQKAKDDKFIEELYDIFTESEKQALLKAVKAYMGH